MQPLLTWEDLESLWHMPVAVVFKHSVRCIRSVYALAELEQYYDEQPTVPFYVLTVQKAKPLSEKLARHTGVTHQTPQILVFRRGELIASASHDDISAGWVEQHTRL